MCRINREEGGFRPPLGLTLPLPARERIARLGVEIGQRIAQARADDGVVFDDVAVQIFDDDVEHFRATVAGRL